MLATLQVSFIASQVSIGSGSRRLVESGRSGRRSRRLPARAGVQQKRCACGSGGPSGTRSSVRGGKHFPVNTDNNSLVPGARCFVRAAQAPTNQHHPRVEPRTGSRNSLKNSLMQGICAGDGFAGDCFLREQVQARARCRLYLCQVPGHAPGWRRSVNSQGQSPRPALDAIRPFRANLLSRRAGQYQVGAGRTNGIGWRSAALRLNAEFAAQR